MEEDKDDYLEHYMSGYIKGTAYGPEKYLNETQKKYRVMNREEYISYSKKVRETKGFDVDGCSGCLPGRVTPLPPTCKDWELACIAAKFAALKQAEDGGKPITFVRLLNANTQPVAGTLYYLTFVAIDNNDKLKKMYHAKVWGKIVGMELVFFEEVRDAAIPVEEVSTPAALADIISNENTDISEKPELAVASEVGECSRQHTRSSVGDSMTSCGNADNLQAMTQAACVEEPEEAQDDVIEATSKELYSSGFVFLLKEVRSQNPNWKYSKVRKAASKKWRSLLLPGKLPYIRKAEEKFVEKWTRHILEKMEDYQNQRRKFNQKWTHLLLGKDVDAVENRRLLV